MTETPSLERLPEPSAPRPPAKPGLNGIRLGDSDLEEMLTETADCPEADAVLQKLREFDVERDDGPPG